jgi:hypothetical protein
LLGPAATTLSYLSVLAINDERTHAFQARESIDHPTNAARMVVVVLGERHSLSTMLVQLNTPTVEFDLVQPLLAARRRGA